MDENIEQRLANLEEEVYGNGETNDDVVDKVGYLQSKMKDAGEALEGFRERQSDLESKMDKIESEDEIREHVEELKREVKAIRDRAGESEDAAKKAADKAQEYLESIESLLVEIRKEKKEVEDLANTFYDSVDEFKQHYDREQAWISINSSLHLTPVIPNCDLAFDLIDIVERGIDEGGSARQFAEKMMYAIACDLPQFEDKTGKPFTDDPSLLHAYVANLLHEVEVASTDVSELDDEAFEPIDKFQEGELGLNEAFSKVDSGKMRAAMGEKAGEFSSTMEEMQREDVDESDYNEIVRQYSDDTRLQIVVMLDELCRDEKVVEEARRFIELVNERMDEDGSDAFNDFDWTIFDSRIGYASGGDA